MIIRILANRGLYIALVCIVGVCTALGSYGAAPMKSIPGTITTQKGKVFNSAQLISVTPSGLVIQYRPQEGGLGMARVKFSDLPESLRSEFNYNESAANEYETAARELMTTRDPTPAQRPKAAADRETVQEPVSSAGTLGTQGVEAGGEAAGAGRFRAAGTIRGAMILDSVTGEAWLLDQHSTLDDYKDQSFFLRPKLEAK